MLKAIQKFISDPKEVNMAQQKPQTELAATELAAQLAVATEALASQSEALQAVSTKLSTLTGLYEASQAALVAAEASQASLVAEAKHKRLSARKEAVVAAVGTSKADALMTATETLDDAAFNAIVGAMTVNMEVEASTPAFNEVGQTGKVDTNLVADAGRKESAEMKILKTKFNK